MEEKNVYFYIMISIYQWFILIMLYFWVVFVRDKGNYFLSSLMEIKMYIQCKYL